MSPFEPTKPANWSHWRKIPQAYVWEAITLSMGFEPGSKSYDANLTDAQELEYDDRLKIADAHIRRGLLNVLALPPRTDPDNMEIAIVDMETFGTFAKRMFTSIPQEFPRDPVNWERWSRLDIEELWRVVAVSLRLSPEGSSLENAKASFPAEFQDRLSTAVNCMKSGSLPVVAWAEWAPPRDNSEILRRMTSGPPPVERSTVRLDQFGIWALSKNYSLPERFPRESTGNELPKEDPPPTQEALDTKPRTSLLAIIGALAKIASVDISHPTTAAKAIVAKLDEDGVKIGTRTVEEFLKEVPDALERRGY